MLALVNRNRMEPPIAPIGLEYVGRAARAAGIPTRIIDLGLTGSPDQALAKGLAEDPLLVGVTFRNVDDCFWPSAAWFVPELTHLVCRIRELCDAPIVLGGVGFSLFGAEIVALTGADFGLCGDGEQSTVALYEALLNGTDLGSVPGLVAAPAPNTGRGGRGSVLRMGFAMPLHWPDELPRLSSRDLVDNKAYFERGGQVGLETKRGCPRQCSYCADPIAKGNAARLRHPADVADEVEALARQGVDVLHLCDGEFNLPRSHAVAVCDELIARGSGVRFYTYATVAPFDRELAAKMRRAGCVGINFTTDAASKPMLERYGALHGPEDIVEAAAICREHGIRSMMDLLLGGPGETTATAAETIAVLKRAQPDCVGASLGMRIYPGTPAHRALAGEGPLEDNPGVRRHYAGRVELVRPTFYVSPALGERPAELVNELIGGDSRFFAPAAESTGGHAGRDHNYNANVALAAAIARGARGAYWDILRSLRG
jgi:radical SAM superfamily enzyme YgiQ (UPF0313 family)